ncbi:MAG: ABC transporter permease [Pyrinomonadaceae bacterium]|nr:ABC transporter permease [Pyrinomonadaceae bacterium]
MNNLVFANVTHRVPRTIVTILGISLGVLMIVLTVGLAHGMLRERGRRESSINAEIRISASGTLGLTGAQPFKLPVSRAEEIARLPGVRAAVPVGQSFDKSDSGFGSRLVDGIPFDEYAALTGLRIKEGAKLASTGDEVIIDEHWKIERSVAVGSTVTLYERPFRIVGVYEPAGGAHVKIPLATMQEQAGGEGHCTAVLVACSDSAAQEEVAQRIREKFPEDQIIFTRDLPEIYASGTPALDVFIKIVVAVAAVISTLVILLAMYTTVTERTRQIGILKALGMSKRKIIWVIEKEAILLSLIGFAAGVALTLAVRFLLVRATQLSIDIEPRWMLVAFVIGFTGSILGALYPALRAARQDAVEALSYE